MKFLCRVAQVFTCLLTCLTFTSSAMTPRVLKRKLLREWEDPAVRAFLDTIAYAEGTYSFGLKGYNAQFKGVLFDSFEDHPGEKLPYADRSTTAAGRYMFLEKIWRVIAERADLHDFSPMNQDLGAICLLWEVHALDPIKEGNVDKAVHCVRKIWSPLPGSPYGQTTTNIYQIRRMFKKRLAHYSNMIDKRVESDGGDDESDE